MQTVVVVEVVEYQVIRWMAEEEEQQTTSRIDCETELEAEVAEVAVEEEA